MFSSKRINTEVIKMYKEQPYIETTVTFITPLDKDSELYQNLVFHTNTIVPVMEGLNNDVEQIIGDTFEADVSSIHCGVKNLFK